MMTFQKIFWENNDDILEIVLLLPGKIMKTFNKFSSFAWENNEDILKINPGKIVMTF